MGVEILTQHRVEKLMNIASTLAMASQLKSDITVWAAGVKHRRY